MTTYWSRKYFHYMFKGKIDFHLCDYSQCKAYCPIDFTFMKGQNEFANIINILICCLIEMNNKSKIIEVN